MLAQRLKTAFAILPVVLFCLYLGGTLFNLLVLLVTSIAVYEYFSFATNFNLQRKIQCSLTVLLPSLGYLLFGFAGLLSFFSVAVVLLFALICVFVESDEHVLDLENLVPACLLGFVYPGLFGTLLLITTDKLSSNYILWALFVIIFTDTFAYFGGSLIGGIKFSPRISPKKTVSGTLVGVISGALISAAVGPYIGIDIGFVSLFFAGFLLSIAGVFGDLAESLIKRTYGVKDSGTILPGHGGVLDRVDALLFAAPLLLLMSRFLGVSW